MNQRGLDITKDAIRRNCTEAKLNAVNLGETKSNTLAILGVVNGACAALTSEKSSALLYAMTLLIASMKNPRVIGHMLEIVSTLMPEFNDAAVQLADVLIEVGEEHATS